MAQPAASAQEQHEAGRQELGVFESDAKEDLTIPSRDMATVAAANCETVGSLSNDTLLMLWNEGPKHWGISDSSDSDNSSSRQMVSVSRVNCPVCYIDRSFCVWEK